VTHVNQNLQWFSANANQSTADLLNSKFDLQEKLGQVRKKENEREEIFLRFFWSSFVCFFLSYCSSLSSLSSTTTATITQTGRLRYRLQSRSQRIEICHGSENCQFGKTETATCHHSTTTTTSSSSSRTESF
jgi:hypothetical protein